MTQCPPCSNDGGAGDDAGCSPQPPQVACSKPGTCGQQLPLGCGQFAQCPPCSIDGGNPPGDDAGSNGDFGDPCGTSNPCTGVFNLCTTTNICSKPCTYPDGSAGPVADPEECPSPSTGECTPKGFCK
jgi:hypothetical protein